jgi:hypothetical protein
LNFSRVLRGAENFHLVLFGNGKSALRFQIEVLLSPNMNFALQRMFSVLETIFKIVFDKSELFELVE